MCREERCNNYSVGFSDYCDNCNNPEKADVVTTDQSVNKYIALGCFVGLIVGLLIGRLF
jgi:hypothetical protein